MNIKGCTSAATFKKVIDKIGYTNVEVLINERMYGNGINKHTIEYVKANKYDLVITFDHGTSNNSFIGEMRELGMDVIITDHHTLKDNTPPNNANVFINPQQEEDSYFKCLSGCAVGYMLGYYLLLSKNIAIEHDNELLDLVAVSTIGDMMDLSDPVNRGITKVGLQRLNQSILGSRLMIHLKMKYIKSRDISFLVVPLINCCSRMGDSHAAYRMLIVSDIDHIDNEIEQNIGMNTARKLNQTKALTRATEQVQRDTRTNTLIVEDADGINGIISSQIGNNTNKPTVTFVWKEGKNTCSGSGRAILPDLNIKKCFDWINTEDNEVFVDGNDGKKYGGHYGAAGCEVNKSKLDKFKELFEQYVVDNNIKKYDNSHEDAIEINTLEELNKELDNVVKLEPFGREWGSPKLKVKPEIIKNVTTFGISPTSKLVSFIGMVNGTQMMFSKFYGIDDDVEIKDRTFVGAIHHNNYKNKLVFDISDII